MAYTLATDLADLYEEFLESEKPKVSAQGFTTLSGMSRRVLEWFDSEELDVREVGITDAVRFASELSVRLTAEGNVISTGTMHNYLKVARRFFDYLVRTERCASNPFWKCAIPGFPITYRATCSPKPRWAGAWVS